MIARRDLLIGGACAVSAGAAAWLAPRRETPLLQKARLADVVPISFGPWNSEEVGDPYAINGEGTLSAKLYNELVTRHYSNSETGAAVMMVLAYGGRQSDELQLHRPEICYPAFGYSLTVNEPIEILLEERVRVPARKLAAEAEGRRESIIYWSRIGELLPQNGVEQRNARLKLSMEGVIPDGLLSRFSTAGYHPSADWLILTEFVNALVWSVAPQWRSVLIGTERAKLLSA